MGGGGGYVPRSPGPWDRRSTREKAQGSWQKYGQMIPPPTPLFHPLLGRLPEVGSSQLQKWDWLWGIRGGQAGCWRLGTLAGQGGAGIWLPCCPSPGSCCKVAPWQPRQAMRPSAQVPLYCIYVSLYWFFPLLLLSHSGGGKGYNIFIFIIPNLCEAFNKTLFPHSQGY